MAVSFVHQREIVEVSFRFLDGIERIHPALVISVDGLQEAEEVGSNNIFVGGIKPYQH